MKTSSYIRENLKRTQKLYEDIASFFENDEIDKDFLQQLFISITQLKMTENKTDFRYFLYFISRITYNSNRFLHLYEKIQLIFNYIKNQISTTFQNYEIFSIFKKNKQILLLFLEEKIIKIDQSMINIISNGKYLSRFYPHYFYHELKSFYDIKLLNKIKTEYPSIDEIEFEQYDNLRKNGENENILCEMIRNDSVKQFIVYVNKNDLSISKMKIQRSIYETNEFLMKNETSLIEYSAFYGSIQIFNYLRMNNVPLTSSLWLYSAHSNNPELIHLLENDHVNPKDVTFCECFKESIKCHQNNIALYIHDKIHSKYEYITINKEKMMFKYAMHYHNYYLIEYVLSSSFVDTDINLSKFCIKYDYLDIVDFLYKNNELVFEYKTILIIII